MTDIDPNNPPTNPASTRTVVAIGISVAVLIALIGIGSVFYLTPDSPWGRTVGSAESTRTVPIERLNLLTMPVPRAPTADPAKK